MDRRRALQIIKSEEMVFNGIIAKTGIIVGICGAVGKLCQNFIVIVHSKHAYFTVTFSQLRINI